MPKYDFMFHTSDRSFSGIGIVEASSEAEAKRFVQNDIHTKRPDVSIRDIKISPTIGVENMKDLLRSNGVEPHEI